jgi:hypothetical protein
LVGCGVAFSCSTALYSSAKACSNSVFIFVHLFCSFMGFH